MVNKHFPVVRAKIISQEMLGYICKYPSIIGRSLHYHQSLVLTAIGPVKPTLYYVLDTGPFRHLHGWRCDAADYPRTARQVWWCQPRIQGNRGTRTGPARFKFVGSNRLLPDGSNKCPGEERPPLAPRGMIPLATGQLMPKTHPDNKRYDTYVGQMLYCKDIRITVCTYIHPYIMISRRAKPGH